MGPSQPGMQIQEGFLEEVASGMELKNAQKSIWPGRGLGGYVGDAGRQHRVCYVGVGADVTGEDGCGHVERPRTGHFHLGHVWL